jgi:hypothetical protein
VGTKAQHFRAGRLQMKQDLDRAPLIHGLVPSSDLVERQLEVE